MNLLNFRHISQRASRVRRGATEIETSQRPGAILEVLKTHRIILHLELKERTCIKAQLEDAKDQRRGASSFWGHGELSFSHLGEVRGSDTGRDPLVRLCGADFSWIFFLSWNIQTLRLSIFVEGEKQTGKFKS